jgi:hypothetical protein
LAGFNRLSDFERQIDAQSLQGSLSIQILASPFACLPLDIRRPMLDDNRRFDLVSVLTTWPATTSALDVAVGQQNI